MSLTQALLDAIAARTGGVEMVETTWGASGPRRPAPDGFVAFRIDSKSVTYTIPRFVKRIYHV